MTREELMIGDIVNVHRCECVADGGQFQEWDEYGKVVSITEYYITIKYIGREEDYGFEDVYVKDINPIPLTPEILEKNGFKFEQQGSLEVAILKMKNRHPITLEYIGWSDGRWSIHEHRLVVKYVHELQHALRLCGVNKEILI